MMFRDNEKLKPATAAEAAECLTPQGIRRRLDTHGYRCDPLVNRVFQQAHYSGLTGEDKYTLLAWHALLALEDTQKYLLERLEPEPRPFIKESRT